MYPGQNKNKNECRGDGTPENGKIRGLLTMVGYYYPKLVGKFCEELRICSDV